MRQFVDVVPPNGVEIRQDRGVDVVFLFKDPQITTDSEGREMLSANVQRSEFPEGADMDEIVAHFDFYFDKAEAAEVKVAAELKINHVQKLLTDSDYKPHKVYDGVMTAEEYAPYKELRQHWRDTINAMRACKTVEELEAIKYAETPEELNHLKNAGIV